MSSTDSQHENICEAPFHISLFCAFLLNSCSVDEVCKERMPKILDDSAIVQRDIFAQDSINKDRDSDEAESERDNDEENKIELECEAEADIIEGFSGSGRTVTLQMLLASKVLQPGRAAMTIEYLGQKFVGDLLSDGKIKSHETETVFLSPSAWAMHCKRIINPDKKSGCGWASVKYKGKKLDAYKAIWMRKCALQNHSTESAGDCLESEFNRKTKTVVPIERIVISYNAIGMRNILHDSSTLIEAVSFKSINKLQPFLVSFVSSALLLADFHTHLTFHEVCGYFGGTWDINSHTLTIAKCYPCKNCRHDREKASFVESEIQKHLLRDQLVLVGWYHSHVKFQPQPTCRDIDAQLDYQIRMRGPTDITYTPCIAFIISPYFEDGHDYESRMTAFWVMPPPENRQIHEYGRPFFMDYGVKQEKDISLDVRKEMEECVNFYGQFNNEIVNFNESYQEIKLIEKLKISLYPKFASKEDKNEFWNFVRNLLNFEDEENFIIPILASRTCDKYHVSTKDHVSLTSDVKTMTLQEQLSLPSGLNMNPTRLTSTLVTSVAVTNTSVITTSSPSASPITFLSNSTSPAKYEIPTRASPSPTKSDTSSSRNRLSPVPSLGKFNVCDISSISPSITPNKCDVNSTSSNCDLITATMSSLNDCASSNLSAIDVNSVFQQQKDYVAPLNQLAVATARAGNKQLLGFTDQSTCEKTIESFYGGSRSNSGKSKPATQLQKYSKQDTKYQKQTHVASYKTKLMKELEDLKNDPMKISELMRSSEYAALLLQQAEALGATTLSTLGLGADFSLGNQSKKQQQVQPQLVDYTNLFQATKLLGYDSYLQQSRSSKDLNTFLQHQLGQTLKKQHPHQNSDYTVMLQTYSKLFDTSNVYASNSLNCKNSNLEFASISHNKSMSPNTSGGSRKQKDSQDMLNLMLQSDKSSEISAFLYNQSKTAADLSALFVTPVVSNNSTPKGVIDSSNYYSQLAQEKVQDYATIFQQQHGKFGIPDPMSKTTLATNNMFMTPTALLKLQQDSLNAMMMKPPKSQSSSLRTKETSSSPAHEYVGQSKGSRGNSPASGSGFKYNFNAADLAISSVMSSNTTSSPSESFHKKTSVTSPVDFTRMFIDATNTKKRMEFSSIADLVAPPPIKQSRLQDHEDNILNLSSN